MAYSGQAIQLTRCVLFPPNPPVSLPTEAKATVYKGKTVYIGGIPTNTTAEMMREAFRRFGEIESIRMNKDSCHVRFVDTKSADEAFSLSGYQIKIDRKHDNSNNGYIHVHYAKTDNDPNANTDNTNVSKNSQLYSNNSIDVNAYERDHFSQTASSSLGSEPHRPIPHSEHEAIGVPNKCIKQNTVRDDLDMLNDWLKRGEGCEENSDTFFSIIQTIYSCASKLMNEKLEHEKELNKRKTMLLQKKNSIMLDCREVAKLFTAARKEKVWSHFTSTQRKELECLQKDMEEQVKAHMLEELKNCANVSMEDGDREEVHQLLVEIEHLHREKATFKCLLEASQKMARLEKKKLQNGIQLHKMQLTLLKAWKEFLMLSLSKIESGASQENQDPRKRKADQDTQESNSKKAKNTRDSNLPDLVTSASCWVVEKQARFIAMVSAFMVVHPFGVSIDYIYAYLHEIGSTILRHDIEPLLKKYPNIFEEESTGIGASLKKKWTFCGFKSRARPGGSTSQAAAVTG